MAVVGGRGVYGGRAHDGTTAADIESGSSGPGIGQREDLADFISLITRDETPFISSIGKTKVNSIYHEWQTDELAPPGDSTLQEGSDYRVPTGYTGVTDIFVTDSITGTSDNGLPEVSPPADAAPGNSFAHTGPNRTRLGNYAQINGKALAISGTRRVIDSAGVADEYAYQLKKRGTELRRDVEWNLIHTAQEADNAGITGRRKFGGYQSFINDSRTVQYVGDWTGAPSGAVGTGRSGLTLQTGVDTGAIRAAQTGTGAPARGALSLSDVDQAMQSLYEEGGKANRLMVSPKLRRDFSDLMVTDTGVRRNLDEKGKLRQSVDVYMSDFGDVMVVPNYVLGLTSNVRFQNNQSAPSALDADTNLANFAALLYDPQWFSIGVLRPLQELDIGQRGDSTVGMMVEEQTFICKNHLGASAIYGLE